MSSFFVYNLSLINIDRKPFTTMWDEMVANYNGGIAVDLQTSFYCGDAAGRKKGWKTGAGNDFSAGKNISFFFFLLYHFFLCTFQLFFSQSFFFVSILFFT